MNADFSRITFKPKIHYRQVRFEQGKIPVEAELNESQDLALDRIETGTQDVVGAVGAPLDNPGFGLSTVNNELQIGAGRLYVDGLMCTLDAPELFHQQSNFPGAALPDDDGVFMAYLDVWSEYINREDDPELREVALLGVRTAGRSRLVPQVKLLQLSDDPADVQECNDPAPAWDDLTAAPTGRLGARAEPRALPEDECSITPGAGYRRLENQLYRVEIHEPGDQDDARYKWSRENGSVMSLLLIVQGDELTLAANSRDRLVGFSPGDWVEIVDRAHELNNEPGSFARIREVDETTIRIDAASLVGDALNTYGYGARVRRWESNANSPLKTLQQDANADGFVALEDGVEVHFSPGIYAKGDYWLIPARTVTGDVEWPQAGNQPAQVGRHGVEHHFARLAVLVNNGGQWSVYRDCRIKFPPLTRQRSCSQIYVGDGIHSHGDFDSVSEALGNLPLDGGTLTLLPGEHEVAEVISNRSNITILGCGKQSKLVPRGNPVALMRFVGCSDIRMSDVSLFHPTGYGVMVASNSWPKRDGFTLERGHIESARSALVLSRIRDVRVEHCTFNLLPSRHGEAVVALACINAVVAWCRINAEHGAQLGSTGWGGVHILSGCSGITLHQNDITGGAGHGITFGGKLSVYDQAEKEIAAGNTAPPVEGRSIELAAGNAKIRVVDENNRPVAGLPVSVAGSRNGKVVIPDDEGGGWLDTGAGETHFYVGSGYKIVDARPDRATDGTELAMLVVKKQPVNVAERVPTELVNGLAQPEKDRGNFGHPDDNKLPISKIRIDNNRISKTGLSGIGVLMDRRVLKKKSMVWRDKTGISAPVEKNNFIGKVFGMFPKDHALMRLSLRDISITGNQIRDTFNAPAVSALGAEELGHGGITLPSVHDLVITDNVIEAFGDARLKPATGIFAIHVAGLTLHNNVVRGEFIDRSDATDPTPGYRGGIVIRLAMQSMNRGKVPGQDTGSGRVSIIGNEIDVQAGRALTMLCVGQIQVKDNLLKSNQTAATQLDQLAGNSLLINLGGLSEILRLSLIAKPKPKPGGLGSIAGHYSIWGDMRDRQRVSTSIVTGAEEDEDPMDLSRVADFRFREEMATNDNVEFVLQRKQFAVDFQSVLFGAGTQFHGNQVMLGPDNQAWCSHLILGFGDIAYDDNQSTTYQRHALPVNAGLAACSVRANNSRFTEAHVPVSLSVAAAAFGAANVCGNHADHCIFVNSAGLGGLGVKKDNNQVLDKERCKKLGQKGLAETIGNLVAFTQVANDDSIAGDLGEAVLGRATPIREMLEVSDSVFVNEGLKSVNTALAATAVVSGEADYFSRKVLADDASALHPAMLDTQEYADIVDRIGELKGVRAGLSELLAEDVGENDMVIEGRLNIGGLDNAGGTKIVLTNGRSEFETTTMAGGFYRLRLADEELAGIPEAERGEWKLVAKGSGDAALSETATEIELKPGTTVVSSLVTAADRVVIAVPEARPPRRPARPARPARPTGGGTSTDDPARPTGGSTPTDDPDRPADTTNPLAAVVTELDGLSEEMAERLVAAGFDTLSKVERARNADLAPIIGTLSPTELRRVIRRIRERG